MWGKKSANITGALLQVILVCAKKMKTAKTMIVSIKRKTSKVKIACVKGPCFSKEGYIHSFHCLFPLNKQKILE